MIYPKPVNLLYVTVVILVEVQMSVLVSHASLDGASGISDDLRSLEVCTANRNRNVFGNFTRHHGKGHRRRPSTTTTTTVLPSTPHWTPRAPSLTPPLTPLALTSHQYSRHTPIDRPSASEWYEVRHRSRHRARETMLAPLEDLFSEQQLFNEDNRGVKRMYRQGTNGNRVTAKEAHSKNGVQEAMIDLSSEQQLFDEDNLREQLFNEDAHRVKRMYRQGSNGNRVSGKEGVSRSSGRIFVSENCSTVVAQVGSTAVLHCEVSDITENTVTWIRKKDYSLLSVGLVTYSADNRFFSAHGKHIKDWSLHIRFVSPSDAGYYECQVPTHPPTSIFFKLVLVTAYAEIAGSGEKLLPLGSRLRLLCTVRRATEPPSYVFWYFQDRMINYDTNGVLVSNRGLMSELLISSVQPVHQGNYSCVPANAKAASVTVHIVQSESPAAMQHGNSSPAAHGRPLSHYILLVTLAAYGRPLSLTLTLVTVTLSVVVTLLASGSVVGLASLADGCRWPVR